MSAVNPYAPPRAAVADVDELSNEVQPVRMWSSQGRIGRLRFLAHMAGAYFLFGFLGVGVGAGLGGAGLRTLAMVVIGLGTIAYFVFIVFKFIQRSHDMDWSGWSVLLAIIPLAGLVWVFKGGSAGANRFGGPPPANTLGVKILALIVPITAVIGILAAIALPAYSDYSKRARQAQMK
ncbi:MAG: putative rane protein [Ramlibacter sp.]|nr:putative rane protein [Ramlibacter sp.]